MSPCCLSCRWDWKLSNLINSISLYNSLHLATSKTVRIASERFQTNLSPHSTCKRRFLHYHPAWSIHLVSRWRLFFYFQAQGNGGMRSTLPLMNFLNGKLLHQILITSVLHYDLNLDHGLGFVCHLMGKGKRIPQVSTWVIQFWRHLYIRSSWPNFNNDIPAQENKLFVMIECSSATKIVASESNPVFSKMWSA